MCVALCAPHGTIPPPDAYRDSCFSGGPGEFNPCTRQGNPAVGEARDFSRGVGGGGGHPDTEPRRCAEIARATQPSFNRARACGTARGISVAYLAAGLGLADQLHADPAASHHKVDAATNRVQSLTHWSSQVRTILGSAGEAQGASAPVGKGGLRAGGGGGARTTPGDVNRRLSRTDSGECAEEGAGIGEPPAPKARS